MLEKNSIISNQLTLEEINKSAEKNIDHFVHNFLKCNMTDDHGLQYL